MKRNFKVVLTMSMVAALAIGPWVVDSSQAALLTEVESTPAGSGSVLQGLASAGAVTTIDFQQLVNNGTLPIGTVITDQFEDQGVVFSLETIADPRYPGPIADGFVLPATCGMFNTFNYYIPILADFSVPVRIVSFSSIVESPLTVQAFDRYGNLLAKASISGAPDVGEISTATDIARLSFLNDSGTGYHGTRSDLTIIRTLSFAIPEPATLLLLGLGGLILRKRRG